MRIARYLKDKKVKYGVQIGDLIHGYKNSPFSLSGKKMGSFFPDGTRHQLSEVKLLAPCTPSKIICLGLNYLSHAVEFNSPVPRRPVIFLKPPTAVIGPEDKIVLPHQGRIDYECELAVVIGRKARNIAEITAPGYILGYTCFNDVTDRDSQKQDGQWTAAKGYDTFAPLGPFIETELDPDNLLVETYLNGKRRQAARTSDLIFSVAETVSFISGIMTLLPGDVIATGTPSGIGQLKHGDTVEIKIEGIGTLRNYVIKDNRS